MLQSKYLIILSLFIGCGSIKVEATNEKIKSENIDVDNSRTIKQETNLDILPFDNSKPMIIDGKKYENVVFKKSEKKEDIQTKRVIVTKTIKVEKTKSVDREDNTFLWIGLFFVLCLFVFLWFKV